MGIQGAEHGADAATRDARRASATHEHFLFMLEGRTYIGSVATGRFAFLVRGAPVWLPTAPPPGGR